MTKESLDALKEKMDYACNFFLHVVPSISFFFHLLYLNQENKIESSLRNPFLKITELERACEVTGG